MEGTKPKFQYTRHDDYDNDEEEEEEEDDDDVEEFKVEVEDEDDEAPSSKKKISLPKEINLPNPMRYNPLVMYDDEEILKMFRFRKQTIMKIVKLLDIQDGGRGGTLPLYPVAQVCMTLRFLATGEFHRVVGSFMNCANGTVHKFIYSIISRIREELHHKLTLDRRSANESKAHHYNAYGMKNEIGSSDCFHVPIGRPEGKYQMYGHEFLNRCNQYSVNVHVACDHLGRFVDVDTNQPGGFGDDEVFKHSQIYTKLQSGEVNGILLADRAYNITPFCIPPYKTMQVNQVQANFNKVHRKAHKVVRSNIRQLQVRFSSLLKGFRVDLDRVGSIVTAALILHNIAIEENEPEIKEDEGEVPPVDSNYYDVEDDEYHYMTKTEAELKKNGEEVRNQMAMNCKQFETCW